MSADNVQSHAKLDERARKQLQHELKIYIEKYFKTKIGKGADHTRVTIWEDIVIIRGEGFLTDPEKFLIETSEGLDVVNSARLQVAKQHAHDNVPHIEKMLGAHVLHQAFLVDAQRNFWMHVMILDRTITQEGSVKQNR
ncbi:MAG: DUF2294 domain-containing protein [Firmicutes bacterium]|nr:DUF2294 domain-containing protein [Bacillota bacterium]